MLVSPTLSHAEIPQPPGSTPHALAATLERCLADVSTRAFRFAEAGVRSSDDALGGVQGAMMKMLV